MGFYIRKSFKAGPMRLNLSKKGLGVSAGVKGARIGSGPRGSYIHAGRGGLYYRQSLNSNSGTRSRHGGSSALGLGSILILIAAFFVINWTFSLINWFSENPGVFFGLTGIAFFFLGLSFYIKLSQKKLLNDYKLKLDKIFILNSESLISIKLAELTKLKKSIKNQSQVDKLKTIEKAVYNALLDKIIDDDEITPEEKQYIKKLESIVDIEDNVKDEIKKEIFISYYCNAILDRKISNTELEILKNIVAGLSIDYESVRDEFRTVQEIIRMQNLSYPLKPIESIPIKLQKSESAYYFGAGKVLSKKKANKKSIHEFEYSLKREGPLVVTNKRLMVIKEGITSVKMGDIVDIDVDLDEKLIILSKSTSSIPTIIQIDEPLYCGKIIELVADHD